MRLIPEKAGCVDLPFNEDICDMSNIVSFSCHLDHLLSQGWD
jgi:hypothetical protein